MQKTGNNAKLIALNAKLFAPNGENLVRINGENLMRND